MSQLRRTVRATSLSVAAVLILGASVLVWSGTANAATPDLYDLTADAVAVQSTFTDPGVPAGLPFSIGSYGASALLNSNGDSSADAGAPYSPLVSSMPSTSNGLAQSAFGVGLPVVPTFPGYVRAKDPLLPLNKQNAGGYALTAIAQPRQSSGNVSMGGQAATADENNAFAFANNAARDDGVSSEGAAGVHALTLGGILDVFNVSSYAALSRDDGGRTVPVTSTNLGTISFAGLDSGLSDHGVSALGSAPVPITVDGLASINQALKPTGITLTYLPEIYAYTDGTTSTGSHRDEKKDISGVMSGALQLFLTNTSDRGTSTETITIGRVSLTATSSSLAAATAGAGTAEVGRPSAGVEAAAEPVIAGPIAEGFPVTPVTEQLVPKGLTYRQLRSEVYVPAALSEAAQEGLTSYESSFLTIAAAAGATVLGARAISLLVARGR